MMSSFFGGRIADIDGAQPSTQIGPQMYGRKSEKNYYKLVKSQKAHVICIWLLGKLFFFAPSITVIISLIAIFNFFNSFPPRESAPLSLSLSLIIRI